jgi:hypothetical protein
MESRRRSGKRVKEKIPRRQDDAAGRIVIEWLLPIGDFPAFD